MTKRKSAPPIPPAPPAPRRWRHLVRPALALALALVVAWAPQLRAFVWPEEERGADRGYVAIVNKVFGPMNWLEFDEPDPEQPGRRVVELSAEAASHAEVIDFYTRSPLIRDIAANDPELWQLSGRSVRGLDPSTRVMPAPFAARRWTGDVLYAASSPAVTLFGETEDGNLRRIELRPLRGGQPAPVLASVSARESSDVVVDQQFQLVDGGNSIAVVRLIGRRVIVFPDDRPNASLVMDTPAGVVRASHDAESGRRAYELVPGGALVVSRNDVPLARFRLGSTSNALSTYRAFAGRRPDLTTGALARDIENAFLASGVTGPRPAMVTLDRDLHQDLQTRLAAFGAKRFAGQRFRSAAVAMDTLTGEVLALASHSGAAGGEDAGETSQRETNNNFSLLPIGSVAKVPVSAAILSQYPALATLRIRSAGADFREALGIDMDGNQVDGPGGEIDFTDFLRRSSNLYATWLMLMALAQDPGTPGSCPSEPYWLAGPNGGAATERRNAPAFVLQRAPAPCGPRFGMPVNGALSSKLRTVGGGPNWVGLLSGLFDLPGVENPASRFDLSVWPRLDERQAEWERAFRAVSPERENFGLGRIRQFHNDYVNLILGGVHSRWSTIKVAEIYSRVVTGRRIQARLLRQRAPAAATPLSELSGSIRLSLLRGLRAVVEDTNGTANPYLSRPGEGAAPRGMLGALAAARNEEVRIFAKTGTPTVARFETVRAWVALRRLEGQRLIVLRDGILRVARARGNESDLSALSRIPQAHAEAAQVGISIGELAAGLQSLRRRVDGMEIRDAGNRLTLPVTRELAPVPGQRNNGGVLALVVGRFCRGDPADAAPRRGVTIVVNFQIRGDENPAGAFARSVLQPDSLLVRRLFQERSNCGGAS